MQYEEYTGFDFGQNSELAPSNVTTEESVWDRHVAANPSGFSFRAWLMLGKAAILLIVIVIWSFMDDAENSGEGSNGEPGIVSIFQSDSP